MELIEIENELKKRLSYSYNWGTKQTDDLDYKTKFIYTINNFDELLTRIENCRCADPEKTILFNYALNRWFNFLSAKAVERIFCSIEGVKAALDERDKLKDFEINGINFDHKTSVFPKGYGKTIDYAMRNKEDLILWLYENQSKEGREHYKNRLFVVLYSNKNEHWKLKAEIIWLKGLIESYVHYFDKDKLIQPKLKNTERPLSDIIWAIK
jgi:hypothetical protein